MKNLTSAVIIVLTVMLGISACEQRGEQAGTGAGDSLTGAAVAEGKNSPEPVEPLFENYTERGDLRAIRKHGVLRLLAPRGESDDALPRDGLPSNAWRELAEKFARNNGLEPQWVYVKTFADLIPALVEGRGDVIATNFSRTPERSRQVAFTRPLQFVRELLITRASSQPQAGAEEPLQVAVRRGSAFANTLSAGEERRERFAITYLEEPVDHDQLLDSVVSGEYPATVIDSNLADAILPSYPELVADRSLDSQRAIAWAVRSNASSLEQALNEFFTAEHLIAEQQDQRPLRDWADIKSSRTLRVLTRNHPASYFVWRGELMGFDYDLLKQFAKENDLRLSMVVPGPDVDLAEALNSGMGDMVAASLTVTDARRQQGLNFTRPYMQVSEQVVAASPLEKSKQEIPVAELLAGQQVAVNPLTSFFANLNTLAESQKASEIEPMQIVAVNGATTEYLIEAVVQGDYPFTIADSHLVAIESTYRDDFSVVAELPGQRDIAWAVREDQPALLGKLDAFLKKHDRGLFFNVTYNKYFKETKRILDHQRERLRTADQLSPYDPVVRKYAAPADRDWRMVVAQMYQESQFNPRATSFAGARGLMQVLPRTAKELGISNLYEPDNAIRAGVSYMQWLEERFPRRLDFDQKIYFTLAAYNAGTGHVRDARKLAQRLGKNPDLWFGHVEEAMLLLSKPEYYRKARFGYVRGKEPVNYVRSIRNRYLGYLSVARKEQAVKNRL